MVRLEKEASLSEAIQKLSKSTIETKNDKQSFLLLRILPESQENTQFQPIIPNLVMERHNSIYFYEIDRKSQDFLYLYEFYPVFAKEIEIPKFLLMDGHGSFFSLSIFL